MLTALMLLVAAAPRVAILSTSGETTTLRVQRVGSVELAPVASVLRHAEGSTVLGALVGEVVVATATTAANGDLSFGSSLFRLDARGARALVDQVALSSRPFVLGGKRVFVQRGRAGPTRLDELTIDEVDARSGETRTVYAARGYVTFIAGALGNELVVYEVGAAGARLIAVHVDSLGTRVVKSELPPFAHDFVVDPVGHRVVYTLGGSADVYSVEATSLDAARPGTRALVRGNNVALLPTVTPDGRVLWSPGPGEGLRQVGGDVRVLAPNGPGYERVRFFTDGLAIGLHERPGDFPQAFAVQLKDGVSLRLAAPAGTRLDVVGVLP